MGNPIFQFDIGCSEKEPTLKFYTELFDWEAEQFGPYSHKLNLGSDNMLGGFITSLGHEPHNYVMLYVVVDNIKETIAKAEELGGSVVVPETDAHGQGFFAWIKDPAGNLLGLWKHNS